MTACPFPGCTNALKTGGPCNDDANHDGRQARWAAEALADAGLLKSPAIDALNAGRTTT